MPYPRVVIVGMVACFVAGCDTVSLPSTDSLPAVVQPQPEAAHHVIFRDGSIKSNVRIEPSHVERDAAGILSVQLNFRSTTEADQYLVAYPTFGLGGEFVERAELQRVVLKGNLRETIYFVSTQPADDYRVTFDFAK